MKISLISIPLACVIFSSCQYRPKNFYANKYPDGNIPADAIGVSSQPSAYDTAYYDAPSHNESKYVPRRLGGDGINYLHRQGETSGSWSSSSSNFVLNNGNTVEIGADDQKVKIKAEVNNLEIIELRLTNIYGGKDYYFDTEKVMNGGQTKRLSKGTYRIDIRNRWETYADPAPSATLKAEW